MYADRRTDRRTDAAKQQHREIKTRAVEENSPRDISTAGLWQLLSVKKYNVVETVER